MDVQQIMRQAQTFQENLRKVQDELADRRFSASSGGGMVMATVNGRGELLDLQLEAPVARGNDSAMLRELVVAAVNAALRESREQNRAEMTRLAGGLNIPGLI